MRKEVETVLASIEKLGTQFFVNGLLYRGKLRKSMPTSAHPLLRYVHRMVTFYSNINPQIPVVTQFYLQDYVDELLGKDVLRVYMSVNGVEHIYRLLDNIADTICEKAGLDGNAFIKKWNIVG